METPVKMDNKIRNKWVKALRSRKFRQGKHQLCTFDKNKGTAKYCCLGVLAKVVEPKLRPSDFEEAVVLADIDIFLKAMSEDLQSTLAYINDSGKATQVMNRALVNRGYKPFPKGKATFGKIAEWIEKNL